MTRPRLTSALADRPRRARRVVAVRIASEERWSTIEDIARLRDGLGVPVPHGTPDVFTEPTEDPIGDLVSRYARAHGPFTTADVAGRLGIGEAVARQALQRLAARGRLLEGEFRPAGSGSGWCDAEVLRKLRRRSLARLRKEVEPVTHETLARFLPAWQRVGGKLRGVDGVVAAIDQLAGCPVPASSLEPLVLGSRVSDYESSYLDELTSNGEVIWAGARAVARQRRLGQPAPRRPGAPDAARSAVGRARRAPAVRARGARARRRVVLPPAQRSARVHG
ncbi:DNA glycosylase AlkZ-like family protein [Nocardioides sp. B-3]|uniref:DNA glycosylase AlkZ-like family protein n=1 Tax=Nocardioides sp. B-3 TaxID=2895565 RepID=UPI0021531523|nr:crosslink repair DNA glycosylase YcaQ family protein [Nocardioides sp. B-3]UUZ58754.1 winged helix DNA-binding domain-containing protein [Nocardioides sp. B-3]